MADAKKYRRRFLYYILENKLAKKRISLVKPGAIKKMQLTDGNDSQI
jgi:hypothetical protein